ncbi:MAG: sigma-70 family RNA polymerase sigma factor [Anaerolineales bacterium]|nr:sigma-70 family RNA polymerase sigma factor [Anaerolineales bacterium]
MNSTEDRLQKREAFVALKEKGEYQGFLLIDDIFAVFPDVEDAEERLDRLFQHFRESGIEIFEDVSQIPDHLLQDLLLDEPSEFDLSEISCDDTVGLYLKEMARVPLLNTHEEVSLAKRIECGKKAEHTIARCNGDLSAEEKDAFFASIEDARSAREHLIKANTRLVVSIAKKYMGRGVPFLDLIQEGNLGLMKAVEKFDYHRGYRFSTYATWWIRQTITRAIADQGRTIRVPVHMSDRIRRLYKVARDLEQEIGRKPTPEEIASILDEDPRKVQWMMRVSWRPLSLESPVGEDEDSELGAFVEDDNTPTPTQSTYQNLLRGKIDDVLATLSPREARILRLRFGLHNGRPYTLEEVGQKFGLTRERIRQIEGKALRRLRHPRRSRQLRDYLS